MQSIKNFGEYVIAANRTPLSLNLSKEVLETRKYLEVSISTSQENYRKATMELDITKQTFIKLQENKHKI